MCRKSFAIATFVRHSISKLPENYYSFPTDIVEHQIAIGKGFSAYMPVINCIFRVNRELMFLFLQILSRKWRAHGSPLFEANVR